MRPRQITVAVFLALYAAQGVAADNGTALEEILVTARRILTPGFGAMGLDSAEIAPKRARTSDTASLLVDMPGVSAYGAGGVSSLPVIRGLADDRLRTKVDGMDLVAACPNHMNSPLSYIDPTAVENVQVYAGVTPVSVGGDSIGGSILVQSAAPVFAQPGGHLAKGEAGAFYRSNGDGWGGNLSGTYATESLSLNYTGAYAQSDNYKAGGDFKDYSFTGRAGHTLPLDEVGSSAYEAINQSVRLAWKSGGTLLDFTYGYQHIPYENYPNQRMDMTDNLSDQFNLGYTGKQGWGTLKARAYYEHTQHQMDFGDDKRFWYGPGLPPSGSGGDTAINGTPCSPISGSEMVKGKMVGCAAGMPMDTDGKNAGVTVSADIPLAERRPGAPRRRVPELSPGRLVVTLRGRHVALYLLEHQRWAARPLCRSSANGRSTRSAGRTSWACASRTWTMDAGPVHGYDLEYLPDQRGRRHGQPDPGCGALQRPVTRQDRPQLGPVLARPFHAGRHPDLRDRPGAKDPLAQSVRALYLVHLADGGLHEQLRRRRQRLCGQPRPATGGRRHPEPHRRLARCRRGAMGPQGDALLHLCAGLHRRGAVGPATNAPRTVPVVDNFTVLKYVNQSALLYGMDLSAHYLVARGTGYGDFTAQVVASYTRGENQDTGDNLYNIMPLNAKLALTQELGPWRNTLEGEFVDAKDDVSQVRNEMQTAGYGLAHLRSRYERRPGAWRSASKTCSTAPMTCPWAAPMSARARP